MHRSSRGRGRSTRSLVAIRRFIAGLCALPLPLLACRAPSSATDLPAPSGGSDTAIERETAETGDTASAAVDCAALPPLPLAIDVLTDISTAEDFDFAPGGYHVSVSPGGVLRGVRRDGQARPYTGGFPPGTACTRTLPSGDLVVCDVAAGALVRVDAATGAKTTLLSGLAYPNGAEVDPDGFVYVSEQVGGRIRRVNSDTGASQVLATGLDQPNGVIFDPTWSTLYVGALAGGRVWALDRVGPASFQPPRLFVQLPDAGDGFLDGINVDVCGNVYLAEYLTGRVLRVAPDGASIQELAVLPSPWLPNLRWGTGTDGWDSTTLHIADRDQGRLFLLSLGVEGKPPVSPP